MDNGPHATKEANNHFDEEIRFGCESIHLEIRCIRFAAQINLERRGLTATTQASTMEKAKKLEESWHLHSLNPSAW